jgi:hypothetical protein
MEILRYALLILAVLAGISVLRNPLRVWPNTLAGIVYFTGALVSLVLRNWWPLIVAWAFSLALQAACTIMIAKGVFNEQINAERAKRGLPPLGGSDVT